MKTQLLIAGLLIGSIFSVTAQVTYPFTAKAYDGAFFGTIYNTGTLTGTLTSIDVNVTLDDSVDATYANDFTIVVADGLTATSTVYLQAGGYTDFGATEHLNWPNGDSDVVGTVCNGSVTLTTPINFTTGTTLKVYMGNGYAGDTNSATWSGSFTLNGVSAVAMGVNDSSKAKFSVYPNPVKDIISVTNTESIAVNSITITDLNGRTVKTVNYNTVSDNIQVNVSDLSSGVYMMNIKSDKGSVTKKIVKN